MPHVRNDMPSSGAFWPKPVNLFGLFAVTTFITDLHYIHHTDYLALTRMRFPGGNASHDVSPAQTTCFGALSRQLFIHAGRFTWWNRWFPPCDSGNNSSKRPRVAANDTR